MDDDRLRLIFTCCHPALGTEAQVALTLRLIAGLQTPEIARAFLVSEPTMAQRLVRAKNKIRAANIPYRVPATPSCPTACVGAGRRLPHLQRGPRRHQRRRAGPRRAVRRGDPPRAPARRADAGRGRGAGSARAAAAHRGAAGRPGPPPTARSCVSPTRTARCGTRSSSTRATRSCARACAGTCPGPYQIQAAIAAVHADAADAPTTPTGRRSCAVRPADPSHADADRRAQSGDRDRRARRARGRAGHRRRTRPRQLPPVSRGPSRSAATVWERYDRGGRCVRPSARARHQRWSNRLTSVAAAPPSATH